MCYILSDVSGAVTVGSVVGCARVELHVIVGSVDIDLDQRGSVSVLVIIVHVEFETGAVVAGSGREGRAAQDRRMVRRQEEPGENIVHDRISVRLVIDRFVAETEVTELVGAFVSNRADR